MKKIFAILVALSAVSMIIAGCGSKEEAGGDNNAAAAPKEGEAPK